MPLTLDLHTFDPGLPAESPEAFAESVARLIEESWDSGADIAVLPEFTWMGLEPLLPPQDTSFHAVAELFWGRLYPSLLRRLTRPGKAAVLGTCPFFDVTHGTLHNRAPIIAGGRALHQDKLHLTPWEAAFTPGDALQLWEFGGLRIAVIICLDIEIPELSARLRGCEVDLILCPSATETVLGVERVDRCASARAVELGCHVGVCHLTGQARAELIDENVGRLAHYLPSQSVFRDAPRCTETAVYTAGCHRLRITLDPCALALMRRMRAETNPALLGREMAGNARVIRVESAPSSPP